MTILTARFWKDTTERALKTGAQFALGSWALGEGMNAFELDWMLGAGFALTGVVASLLTSIASISVGEPGTASAVNDTETQV